MVHKQTCKELAWGHSCLYLYNTPKCINGLKGNSQSNTYSCPYLSTTDQVHKQTHKELHEADLPVVIADHVLEGQEATSVRADGDAS